MFSAKTYLCVLYEVHKPNAYWWSYVCVSTCSTSRILNGLFKYSSTPKAVGKIYMTLEWNYNSQETACRKRIPSHTAQYISHLRSATWAGHGSGSQSPPSHREGPGQSMWELRRSKWHCVRLFPTFFGFPLSVSFYWSSSYSYHLGDE
jgi:hypothetical protein